MTGEASVLEKVLLVFVGWLLATLNPGIVEAIRRRNRRGQLLDAVAVELRELRYKVALVLWRIRTGAGALDQPTLNTIKPLIVGHPIPEGEADMMPAFKKLLELGDETYIKLHNAKGAADDPGFWPAPYRAPFLSTHTDEFTLFSADTQGRLMRVLEEIDLFNNQVDYVRNLHEKTFVLSGANHAINLTNLKKAQLNLGTRSEFLIASISRIVGSDGRRLSVLK